MFGHRLGLARTLHHASALGLCGLMAFGCADLPPEAFEEDVEIDEAVEALGAYDHCDQVLRGDLFNKVNGTLVDAAGRVLGSFTSSARLPPGQEPQLGAVKAVGACTSADVRRVIDSYWRAFGRAPNTDEGGDEVAGWCERTAPTFEQLMGNHKWFLTTQGASSALVRNTIDRSYRIVFGHPADEASIAAWTPGVLRGMTFAEITASHGWWAGQNGISCTSTVWERTTPTSVPLCFR